MGWLGSIAGIVAVFIMLNGFLYSVKVNIGDYFLANGFLIIIGYLTFLTYELFKLKGEQEDAKTNKKEG